MPKAMKYRDLTRALLGVGCTWRPGKGDHEVWYCSATCGQHHAVITHTREISAGVVGDVIKKLACLPEGTL